jgi:signal transduction histidine kinase
MTLSIFIAENVDQILIQWTAFARTLAPKSDLDLAALQDHAKLMLLAVAREMESQQSDAQQQTKSQGHAPLDFDADESAAQLHGNQRYGVGFSLEELVAEYRALRATVIRLWMAQTAVDEHTLYEVTRFNEGIDQLLAESVSYFSKQLDRARQLFMGVLGHDLRSDLQVIFACTERLERAPSKEKLEKYVPYIRQSANNIHALVGDLLDVARTRLGGELPIALTTVDGAGVCRQVLAPFRELHANCNFQLQINGDVTGEWDYNRMQQLLTNLVRNAIQHGDAGRQITLSADDDGESVLFKVHNFGPMIPRHLIGHIFDPLRQGDARTDGSSLGLGLYIADAIAQGHHGKISVTSSEPEGTTFVVTLPRSADANYV